MYSTTRIAGDRLILRHKTTGEEITILLSRIIPGGAQIGIDASQDWKIRRVDRQEDISFPQGGAENEFRKIR